MYKQIDSTCIEQRNHPRSLYLVLLNLALFATRVDGLVILLLIFLRNSRTLAAPISAWTLASLALSAFTARTLHRTTSHALRVAIASASALAAWRAAGFTAVV